MRGGSGDCQARVGGSGDAAGEKPQKERSAESRLGPLPGESGRGVGRDRGREGRSLAKSWTKRLSVEAEAEVELCCAVLMLTRAGLGVCKWWWWLLCLYEQVQSIVSRPAQV